ncbi:hypothetical protein SOVF_172340 [Spinacia oleracea]|nr:hypothetical protein SOVF_172340 [Spinacia oleracea]
MLEQGIINHPIVSFGESGQKSNEVGILLAKIEEFEHTSLHSDLNCCCCLLLCLLLLLHTALHSDLNCCCCVASLMRHQHGLMSD